MAGMYSNSKTKRNNSNARRLQMNWTTSGDYNILKRLINPQDTYI